MDFKSRYRRECLLKGYSPLHVIEACLADAILKFSFFRVPPSEWTPILSTLKSNFTIKKINVMIEDDLVINKKIHQQKLKHLNSFMETLCVHLGNNQILTQLELVGLPFSYADIAHLNKGIVDSNSLQYICLAESKIGDEGLINVIEAIKMKPNIVWLDLRNCGLTCKVGKPLASLVHFQALARGNAAWKATLREETPNFDLMGGLRRLSLSGNHLCDAVRHLALALYEDKWIKAIDLQFCDLENTHVEQLIKAAEKNQSLIFLDISNNSALNSELLNKLEEVLSCNSLKHPPLMFESINLPKRTSNVVSVNQIKGKHFDYQVASSKEVNPISTTRNKVNLLGTKFSDNKESTKVKPLDQITDPMTDLLKERKLRNDAEQQVIKISSEMELARTRITKLEEEVKHIGAKQKKLAVKSVLPDHSKVFENDVSNHSLTQSFLICLKRLQGVLKELKLTSAVSRCSDLKDPSQEIQGILDSVYTAVREFAPNVNRLISESYRPLNNVIDSSNKATAISGCTVPRNEDGKHPAEHRSAKSTNSSFSSNQKSEKKDKNCENLFKVLDKNLVESVSFASDRIQTSAMVKDDISNHSQTINLVNFSAPKPPPVFDLSQKRQQNSRQGSTCVNSLKSLQSNLEEILQELSEKNYDASIDKMDLGSQLTITGNFTDLNNQEAESHYSTDFDSVCSSIKSISKYSSIANRRPSYSDKTLTKSEVPTESKKRNFGLQEHHSSSLHFSSSSSSLNLSSIVDLLGNFSVEDIGSSTLTPP